MCDGKHEKAMSGGDTTGDNNDDFFACISQLNTAFVIQHGIVDSLDHCCCRIAVPMEQRHDLVSKNKKHNSIKTTMRIENGVAKLVEHAFSSRFFVR